MFIALGLDQIAVNLQPLCEFVSAEYVSELVRVVSSLSA